MNEILKAGIQLNKSVQNIYRPCTLIKISQLNCGECTATPCRKSPVKEIFELLVEKAFPRKFITAFRFRQLNAKDGNLP